MGLVSSLASIVGVSETSTPVTAAIGELDPVTGFEKRDSTQAFQYFPENIKDSKNPEYSSRSVPGGSHPIKSFVSGGDRTISFSAVFTQEDNPEPQGLVNKFLTGSLSVNVNPISLFTKSAPRKDTCDIAAAVAFLRSFTYPEYQNNVAKAPPACVIYLPNSGILGHPNIPDSIIGVMTQCEVTYEVFHRNGAPRIVVVDLSFSEIVQVGGAWQFVGREKIQGMLQAMGHADSYKRTTIGLRSAQTTGQNANNIASNLAGATTKITGNG